MLLREVISNLCLSLCRIEEKANPCEKERRMENETSTKLVSALAGGMAHNFNNLLMGIKGNTTLMLLDTHPADPNYERITKIDELVQRGARLTKLLLGYAGKGKYEIRPIDLNKIVENIDCKFNGKPRNIRVHKDLEQGLNAVKGDYGQMEHVLFNLYENAVDSMMAQGGDLLLATRNISYSNAGKKGCGLSPGDYVLLTLSDTGGGMDQGTMERMFEPFFSTKDFKKNTGLGLAAVYGIVNSYGGYIDVKSEIGRGTTINIYLPASKIDAG